MALQGTLDSFSPDEILRFLADAAKTGALHVHGENDGVAWLSEGRVAYATARADDDLGGALVAAGVLTPAAWEAALAAAQAGDPLGDALAAVDPSGGDHVGRFLEERSTEATFELHRWRSGSFEFVPGEVHPLGNRFALAMESLLEQVRGRLDEWAVIGERIPSLRLYVDLAPRLPAETDQVTLDRSQWEVVAAADGAHTVADLAAVLGQGTFGTCRTLHTLLAAGVVRLVDEPRVPVPLGDVPAPTSDGVAEVVALRASVSGAAAAGPGLDFVPSVQGGRPNRDLVLRLLSAVKEL